MKLLIEIKYGNNSSLLEKSLACVMFHRLIVRLKKDEDSVGK